MGNLPIFITQPVVPPLEEFMPFLEKIWDSKVLSNGGTYHRELEQALCEYLGVDHLSLFNNGTIALIAALKSLDIMGEVITTPYSFVATAHALLWNNLTPVFIDIDPNTLNMDPTKIEDAITPRTSAILPVHCYGHPCNVDAIQIIADRNNLKVVYDSAHAFGVQNEGGGVLRHGDLSILSFHATKVFNTFEGGAIVCKNKDQKKRIDQLKNFGIGDQDTAESLGINGKLSEINSAFGLLQLRYIDQAIAGRKKIDQLYRDNFKDVKGIHCIEVLAQDTSNYSYFPILIESDYAISRDELYELLKTQNIFTKRYFYPLITDCSPYTDFTSAQPELLPYAKNAAQRVLCLPIYPTLSETDQMRVIESIRTTGNSGRILKSPK